MRFLTQEGKLPREFCSAQQGIRGGCGSAMLRIPCLRQRDSRPRKPTKKDTARVSKAPAGILLRPTRHPRRMRLRNVANPLPAATVSSEAGEPTKKDTARVSFFVGAPAGTRIPDPLIKSQMLYRLSYGGVQIVLVYNITFK